MEVENRFLFFMFLLLWAHISLPSRLFEHHFSQKYTSNELWIQWSYLFGTVQFKFTWSKCTSSQIYKVWTRFNSCEPFNVSFPVSEYEVGVTKGLMPFLHIQCQKNEDCKAGECCRFYWYWFWKIRRCFKQRTENQTCLLKTVSVFHFFRRSWLKANTSTTKCC